MVHLFLLRLPRQISGKRIVFSSRGAEMTKSLKRWRRGTLKKKVSEAKWFSLSDTAVEVVMLRNGEKKSLHFMSQSDWEFGRKQLCHLKNLHIFEPRKPCNYQSS